MTGMTISTAGISLGYNGDENNLRYNWNSDPNAYGWISGLTVPDDRWVFVALVVEPTQAKMYLYDNGVMNLATNVTGHAKEQFDEILLLRP